MSPTFFVISPLFCSDTSDPEAILERPLDQVLDHRHQFLFEGFLFSLVWPSDLVLAEYIGKRLDDLSHEVFFVFVFHMFFCRRK